jgi:hypothetical protein
MGTRCKNVAGENPVNNNNIFVPAWAVDAVDDGKLLGVHAGRVVTVEVSYVVEFVVVA